MGTYYMWVNYDKRQYLSALPFKVSKKIVGSCWVGCKMTDAASTLLAGDWNGDLVAFVGDDNGMGKACCGDDPPESHREIRRLTHGEPYDFAEDWYDDVAGRFEEMREQDCIVRVGEGLEADWVDSRYSGPFDMAIVHYRYIVNATKGEFYDRSVSECDPLPLLMSSSWGLLDIEGQVYCDYDGIWVGDKVTPAHTPPEGEGYADVTGVYSLF